MITQSYYTKEFKSNDLTHLKYNELRAFAEALRDHRNSVSEYVNSNLMFFLDMSKFTFLKEMRARFKDIVPSSFEPRKLKREKVKEVLLSFRGSLSKAGCESPSLSVG